MTDVVIAACADGFPIPNLAEVRVGYQDVAGHTVVDEDANVPDQPGSEGLLDYDNEPDQYRNDDGGDREHQDEHREG